MDTMEHCMLCPRACGADRLHGKTGYCGMTAALRVARVALHQWEEPCISGTNGSGTVFFSGCPLRCVYCQNHEIALGHGGKPMTIPELADSFLSLQAQGAHNIKLVTPTHYIPQIVQALRIAKADGLSLPIVYNTGSYETVEALRMLEGLIDIYLPDCKYFNAAFAQTYSHAPDYFAVATAAIAEMVRQVGAPQFDEASGLMQRGVLVRHLLLPTHTADSKAIVRYLYETYGDGIYLSLMNQYTPLPHVADIPVLTQPVTEAAYDEVVDYAIELGVENGFIQEGGTVSESFIPPFTLE